MSAEATGWVWRHSTHSGAPLLVTLAIADVVNDVHDNEFWMSVANLARKARVSRSTAADALRELVEDGTLEVVESGKAQRKPTRYRFRPTSPVSGLALVQSGESTSPVSGLNTKKETQEPKGASQKGQTDCPRCQGRGEYFHAGAGSDVECNCVREAESA